MSNKAIDSRVYLASVRSSPRFGDNIIGTLNQCDPVETIGQQQGDRWIPCRVEINGNIREAFISKNVLRDRASEPKEKLARLCVREWLRFDKGKGKEHHDPFFRFVGEYWGSISMDLNGHDRDVPWSAAFISFCIKTSDYHGFKFAAAHARYTHQAIRRKLDNIDGPFWGFRINEHKPQIGDMVCRGRSGSGVTYNHASTHDQFKSHCDIVTGISKARVSTIGGNVGHSVSRTSYPLNSSGFLANDGKLYAVLRNNL